MRLLLILLLLSSVYSNDRGPTLHFDSLFEQDVFEAVLKDPSSHPFITAILVSEGVLDTATIAKFSSSLNTLIANIEKKLDKSDDVEDQAEFIYDYLYKTLFKKFDEAALLKNVFRDKSFNSIVCSDLYYVICNNFALKVNIETNNWFSNTWMLIEQDTVRMFFDLDGKLFDEEFEFDGDLGVLEEPLLNVLEETKKEYDNISITLSQMSLNYNNRGVFDLKKGAIKSALFKFEKAVKLNPNNDLLNKNYESTLHALHGITRNYTEFVPYLKNSFFLLNKQKYNVNNMLVMLSQAIYHYSTELLHFNAALELIFDARLAFSEEAVNVALDKSEKDIYLKKIYTHARRGSFRKAYQEAKSLYYSKEKLPMYKEILVEIGLAYVNTSISRRNISKEIQNAVDTLYKEAPDYASVEETFISVSLQPVISDPAIISDTPYKARKKVLPLYNKFPENQMIKQVLARIYYNMSMAKVRQNKLEEAFAILEEGLKHVPGNKMLLDAQDSILRHYD